MDATSYHDIRTSLRRLYLGDPCPWIVGFSGGKDSTLLASLDRPLHKLHTNASNGECSIQIHTTTPSCGNSRFGCWTCAVVARVRLSEELLAA